MRRQMWTHGQIRKIAWSRSGCVAYVGSDGKSVRLTSYPLDAKSPATILDTGQAHRDGGDILHLCWDAPGSSLAIIDSLGRILIYRANHCLNHLTVTGQHSPDKVDMCNGVVGMQWISSKGPEVYHPSVDLSS